MNNRDSVDDYRVEVDYDPTVGIRLTLKVGKVPLVTTFGDLPASREKALSVANRLASDLGVNVHTKLPRSGDIEQPRHYQPHIPLR